MVDVMEKVIDLQKTLDNFIKNAGIEYNKAISLQIANQLAIAEMKREFEEEIRKSNTELNKKIGEQANRLGRIVEDLVLPSMPRVIIEKFGFELERFLVMGIGSEIMELKNTEGFMPREY